MKPTLDTWFYDYSSLKKMSTIFKYCILQHKGLIGYGNDVVFMPKISKIVISLIPLLMYSIRVLET